MAIATCPAACNRKSTSSGLTEFSIRLPRVRTPTVRFRLIRGRAQPDSRSSARAMGVDQSLTKTGSCSYDMRLAGLEHPAQLGPFDRQMPTLLHESLALREVHSKLAQMDLLRVREPHSNDVATHDLPNACRDGAKKIATSQIRDQGIHYVQE